MWSRCQLVDYRLHVFRKMPTLFASLLVLSVVCLTPGEAQQATPTPTPDFVARFGTLESQVIEVRQFLTPTSTAIYETRIVALESQVQSLNEQLAVPQKDIFDIITSIAGGISALSGVLLALLGVYITHTYRKRQESIDEGNKQTDTNLTSIQIVQTFMPYLHSNKPKEVEGALLALHELGKPELAMRYATLYQNDGALSALIKIASSSSGDNRSLQLHEAFKSLKAAYTSHIPATVSIQSGLNPKFLSTGFIVHSTGIVVTTDFALNDAPDVIIRVGSQEIKGCSSPSFKNYLGSFRLPRALGENSQVISYPYLIAYEEEVVEGEEVTILGLIDVIDETMALKGQIEKIEAALPNYDEIPFLVARLSLSFSSLRGAPVFNQVQHAIGIVSHVQERRNGDDGYAVYIIPSRYINTISLSADSPS